VDIAIDDTKITASMSVSQLISVFWLYVIALVSFVSMVYLYARERRKAKAESNGDLSDILLGATETVVEGVAEGIRSAAEGAASAIGDLAP